jgi:hypothetical protein
MPIGRAKSEYSAAKMGLSAGCRNTGNTSADTPTPYHAQYPLNFQLVNATGVPVFRTRQVAILRGTGIRSAGPRRVFVSALPSRNSSYPYIGTLRAVTISPPYGRGMASPGDMLRSGIGTLVSRMGRSTSPGPAGASRPSVSRKPCKARPLVHTPSRAAMYSI